MSVCHKLELMLIKDNSWEMIKNEGLPATDTKATTAWNKKDDKARAKIGLLVDDV